MNNFSAIATAQRNQISFQEFSQILSLMLFIARSIPTPKIILIPEIIKALKTILLSILYIY